jgi:hypothetical protein
MRGLLKRKATGGRDRITNGKARELLQGKDKGGRDEG